MWREGSGEGKQNVDLLRTVCSRLPSEHTDLELGFRSGAPAPLFTMFGNAYPADGILENGEGQTQEQLQQSPQFISVSIPKLEPYSPSSSDTEDNVSNDEQLLTSPIPFTTPYKVRDPIVLLERCDKIWETLKLIKNVQGSNSSCDTIDTLPADMSSSSLYIKYQPVLGNDNAALPNFQFSVKTTKKLYYCSTCGRQYTHNRALRYHSEKVHGIYIAPKRCINTILNWRNTTDKEKACNEAAKEKSSLEKIPVKKNENKLCTDALSEPVPAQVTEVMLSNNTENVQSQQKRRTILTREAKNPTVSKTVTNEQEKEVLPKKFRPNEKPHFLRNDAVSPQCVLCKQFVKDVKKHLTDYHKINSPDFMLKEIEKTSAISQIKELEKIYVNNECSNEEEEITQVENSAEHRRKTKRRSNVSSSGDSKKVHETSSKNTSPVRVLPAADEFECEVCRGIYSLKSYARHMRTHQERGQTKENFHLFHCNYYKSPLYGKSKASANSSDLSSEDTSSQKDTNEKTIVRKQNKREKFSMRHNRKDETTCTCGRAFRNPHTLFIHKGKCNFQNEELELSTRGDILNASTESATRSSLDRDSGIGISIRIKKKNNSYEVVGKDTENEDMLNFNGLKDSGASSDISDDSSQEEPQDRSDILESSKYSEYHSILKIELADEDIDVDIEEDSQNSLWDNNINDTLTTDEVTNDFAKEDGTAEQPLGTERKDKTTKLKSTDKKHECVCGSWFSTKENFEAHTDEHRQSAHLMCGYCKQRFPNLNAWHQHQCSVREGKAFIDLPMLLNCPLCTAAFHTFKKFDEHIKLKHIDFVVPYQCYYCNKRFPNPTARLSHIRADHSTLPCSLCKKKYPDIMKSRHEGYHYGLGFPCHVCRKTYINRFYLSAHKGKVHPKISTYSIICDNCKSRFPNEKDLKTHTKDGSCRKSSWAAEKLELES